MIVPNLFKFTIHRIYFELAQIAGSNETISFIKIEKLKYLYYYLINIWSSKQSFVASASGRFTQGKALDSLRKTADLSFSCPKETDASD